MTIDDAEIEMMRKRAAQKKLEMFEGALAGTVVGLFIGLMIGLPIGATIGKISTDSILGILMGFGVCLLMALIGAYVGRKQARLKWEAR